MNRTVLLVVEQMTFDAFIFYAWASIIAAVLRRFTPGWDRRGFVAIRRELKPFALSLLCASFAATALLGHVGWGDRFALLFNALTWLMLRHLDEDGDDRWKRRRAKLAAKVAEVGGQLQVVPQEAP